MAEFGLNTLTKTGRNVSVIADGNMNGAKVGGISLDLSTIATVATNPVTVADDTVVAVGNQYLRFGQILTKITAGATFTVTANNTPTGGTYTLSVTLGTTVYTTTALAFNASNATIQAAIITALGSQGTGNVVVSGGALPGTPAVVTFGSPLSYGQAVGYIALTGNGALLTGAGSQPTITTANTADGNVGYFGPYDPAATDGRQTLTRGEAYILNRTWMRDPPVGFAQMGILHPPVFDAGMVWKARLLITSGAHSLAAGPTIAEFEAAFPNVRYVTQNLTGGLTNL